MRPEIPSPQLPASELDHASQREQLERMQCFHPCPRYFSFAQVLNDFAAERLIGSLFMNAT